MDKEVRALSPGECRDPMPLDGQEPALLGGSAARTGCHNVSHTAVGELLKVPGFSLQANRKAREGDSHPDRDAQFAYINTRVTQALSEQQPVIWVDTKRSWSGAFKNAGREWRPRGNPEEVRVHDFLIKELGRTVPYRVYDLADNAGWVSVGIDHDAAAFCHADDPQLRTHAA